MQSSCNRVPHKLFVTVSFTGLRRLASVSSISISIPASVSNGYTLKDEYCHYLTHDATIMVSYKFPIIGHQVVMNYYFT